VRARKRESVCERERARARESVYVCMSERKRDKGKCVCARARVYTRPLISSGVFQIERVSVCVRERVRACVRT